LPLPGSRSRSCPPRRHTQDREDVPAQALLADIVRTIKADPKAEQAGEHYRDGVIGTLADAKQAVTEWRDAITEGW
jgi:hypothetical protein